MSTKDKTVSRKDDKRLSARTDGSLKQKFSDVQDGAEKFAADFGRLATRQFSIVKTTIEDFIGTAARIAAAIAEELKDDVAGVKRRLAETEAPSGKTPPRSAKPVAKKKAPARKKAATRKRPTARRRPATKKTATRRTTAKKRTPSRSKAVGKRR
jgi:hypothetical protein